MSKNLNWPKRPQWLRWPKWLHLAHDDFANFQIAGLVLGLGFIACLINIIFF